MAAVTEVRTFWAALLSVLLKCVAALGFAPARNRVTAVTTSAAPTALGAGRAVGAAQVTGAAGPHGAPGGLARSGDSPRTGGGEQAAPGDRRSRFGLSWVPAQRGAQAPRLARREHKRSLPPTMRQRIAAEAHGSTPSGRSLRLDDALGEDYTGAVTIPAPAEREARPGRRDVRPDADRPTAVRADAVHPGADRGGARREVERAGHRA